MFRKTFAPNFEVGQIRYKIIRFKPLKHNRNRHLNIVKSVGFHAEKGKVDWSESALRTVGQQQQYYY